MHLHYFPINIIDNTKWNRVKWFIVTSPGRFGGLVIMEVRFSIITLFGKLV